MARTLVLLAAGMGSRFGGPKQLEPLGPHSSTMIDYAIYDARRAGFSKVVLVIRQAMQDVFEETVAARWRPHLPVTFVFQQLHDLPDGYAVPAGREKPWGTGQAVLAVAPIVDDAFAVANADDFYGAGAYEALAHFFERGAEGRVPPYANVGFALQDTLVDTGSVNRAVLRTDADGWLQRIEEVLDIERDGADGRYRAADGTEHRLAGTTRVSMNLWGFTPALFRQLEEGFRAFLAEHGAAEKTEFLLPDYVAVLIDAGRARVQVCSGGGPWCGVTYPEDRERVQTFLHDLVERGVYPEKLWT